MIRVKFYRYAFASPIWFPDVRIGPMPWRGKRIWELSAWWLWGGMTLQWWFQNRTSK